MGRPDFDARGRKGSIFAHSSSVRSLGYRLVFFSILAIRPRVDGVHIPSLNHGRKTLSTSFQTDSYENYNTETKKIQSGFMESITADFTFLANVRYSEATQDLELFCLNR